MAAPGDKISVGPGVYGDLSRDGDFDDPGEEAAEVSSGCHCVLKVDKTVTIFSSSGAGATVIDAGAFSGWEVVSISGNGAVFGQKNKGFTVTAPQSTLASGIVIESGTSGVQVGGNTLEGLSGRGIEESAGTGSVVRFNRVLAVGSEAFFVLGDNGLYEGNLATGSPTGFFLTGSVAGTVLKKNVITSNGTGVILNTGDTVTLTQNAIVGNYVTGVEPAPPAASLSLTLSENNIFGNGEQGDPMGAVNCGIYFGFFDMGATVSATNNYWGAATGPGPNPADLAGTGLCDVDIGMPKGNSVTTDPPATKPFTIKLTAQR
jgi:hypothetical protein